MSADVTPAIERATPALREMLATEGVFVASDHPRLANVAHRALDAALDVEEMARALYMRPSRDKDFPTWEDQSDHVRGYWHEYARVIRAALLGADS